MLNYDKVLIKAPQYIHKIKYAMNKENTYYFYVSVSQVNNRNV